MAKLKTFVVAGMPRTGTTVAMRIHMESGIGGLYTSPPNPVHVYPKMVYEWPQGLLRRGDIEGKVIKRFWDTLCDDMPADLDDIYVMYMIRDPQARRLAHPGEVFIYEEEYWKKHIDCIRRISNDWRVAKLYVCDFDRLIDHPTTVLSEMICHGWPIRMEEALKIIDPNQRHAKAGDTDSELARVVVENKPEIQLIKSMPVANTDHPASKRFIARAAEKRKR